MLTAHHTWLTCGGLSRYVRPNSTIATAVDPILRDGRATYTVGCAIGYFSCLLRYLNGVAQTLPSEAARILRENCAQCHANATAMSRLRVTSREGC